MRVLKVIHGYPFRYNAGSEVYSQTLCHELNRQGHEVVVFTRQANTYLQEYSIHWELDPLCSDIKLCLVNMAHSKEGYRYSAVDRAFASLIDEYKPDIVHIGHLNHLSTSLVLEAHRREIPIIFTLHDFWLMCPRGQFLQANNTKTADLYPTCDSQENEKCAKQCFCRHFSSQDNREDFEYWTQWVGRRMEHVREMASYVDLFIAPSRYLMNRFIHDFSIACSKIVYLDYGFHLQRLQGRSRQREKNIVFGYIGTHQQAKGIHLLLQAFHQIYPHAELKIWGSPLAPFTSSLQAYAKSLGPDVESRIRWMGGYRNDQIVSEVFNHVDAIVVPSIWGENSPLVIHEALEAKVPVITANYGGMKEYVEHEINGLLFTHRDSVSLAEQMRRFITEPDLADKITQKGYLQSDNGHIPSIEEHVEQMISLYALATERRRASYGSETRTLAHHI